MKIPNFHFSRYYVPMGRLKSSKKDLLLSEINLGFLFVVEPCPHFVVKVLGDRANQECVFEGMWTFAK